MPKSAERTVEDRFPHVPFPGEREPDTLTPTLPGAVGGIGFGADAPPADLEPTMDPETIKEYRKEGGGRI